MMKKNKLLFALLLLATFSFVFFSTGGEFLHSKIHHHHTQSSNDQCPVYQLLAQVFIALSAFVFAAFSPIISRSMRRSSEFVFQSLHNLPNLRAPPVSLS